MLIRKAAAATSSAGLPECAGKFPAGQAGPKNVLVIGASTGYGLASRIAAAWGYGAKTLGVFFERPPDGDKTATAGHYNTVAFHSLAQQGWTVCREHQRRCVFR